MIKANQPVTAQVDLTSIECLAWQLRELFRVIEDADPTSSSSDISISTLALIGGRLSENLANHLGDGVPLFGSGKRNTETPPDLRPEPAAILSSYRQTVDGAAQLLATLKCANLKRTSIVDREAIDRAIVEMDGHITVAREDFLGGDDHE